MERSHFTVYKLKKRSFIIKGECCLIFIRSEICYKKCNYLNFSTDTVQYICHWYVHETILRSYLNVGELVIDMPVVQAIREQVFYRE